MNLIFGDNQFFGINHMSEEKAQSLAERFCTVDAIIRVIDEAYEAGIRNFMFTTHDRVAEICDHFRRFPSRYADLKIYPAMPYAHKYANLVTDKGLLGALVEVLRGSGSSSALHTVVRAGVGALQQDPLAMMHLLIDAELRTFRGLRVEALFLQNILTDLLLGLGAESALVDFVSYVKDRHGVDAGFITMNLPVLSAALNRAGLHNSLLCASFNKAGYLMNPSKQAYEETVREGKQRFIAMSVFASGAVPVRQAAEYVGAFESIEGVLFGASSKEHIGETVELFQQQSAAVLA